MEYKIMLVEDDASIAKLISSHIEKYGYKPTIVSDFDRILDVFIEEKPHLVLLDINLPKYDGFYWCRKIRDISKVPIIFLSSRDSNMDIVMAVNMGGDDYVTKPFNILELKARIKAILRRVNMISPQIDKQSIKLDDFVINALGRKLTINGKNINLTGKEFDLFYILISNPGKVFTREELLETVWGYEYFGDLRTVDVHIRRLREKIEEDPANTQYIHTKWGVGYYFRNKKEISNTKQERKS